LRNIIRYQSNDVQKIFDQFFHARLRLRKHFLENPCFTVFEGISPAMAIDSEWVEIVGDFTEAIDDHLVFMRAMQVETGKGFKELFQTRLIVLRTGFEDRLQLFFDHDVTDETPLKNFWPA